MLNFGARVGGGGVKIVSNELADISLSNNILERGIRSTPISVPTGRAISDSPQFQQIQRYSLMLCRHGFRISAKGLNMTPANTRTTFLLKRNSSVWGQGGAGATSLLPHRTALDRSGILRHTRCKMAATIFQMVSAYLKEKPSAFMASMTTR